MIDIGIVEARIKRQKVAEQAGEYFVPREAIRSRIGALKDRVDEQFLFGIFKNNDMWTALSVNKIVGCYDGALSELIIQNESEVFHDYFIDDEGKKKSDIILADGRRFWMMSIGISCSFQNIILMLQGLPDDIRLDE